MFLSDNMLALVFLFSAGLVLGLGDAVIALLGRRSARQPVSGDAPASHQAKQGTPTMGGLLLVAVAFVITVAFTLLAALDERQRVRLLAVAGTLLLAGIVGFLDDLGKARRKQNKAGLSERVKLAGQVLVAALFLFVIGQTEQAGITTVVAVFGRNIDFGILYYALGVLYLCGFGNAVNFTDGLDGLAAGTTLITTLSLAVLALLNESAAVTPEVSIFYLSVAGACAGFLWFNAHPARVFMGDTGSLALGMGVAAAAIAAKQETLLLVVGAVYLMEIGSMMIQRYVFKWRRIRRGIEYAKANRVFRRAPLHHHFEELGWPETRVVARFWVMALMAAAVGAALAPLLSPYTVTVVAP